MKIMKNILIPIVLFISLFFNTSTIFAANNLNTTFNANNDELTVTVKNNSDKELSDVEYNLNLPSEYTAKYAVNPDYSLSPQKETTFKVKVSKAGNDVSNNGEKGTKTFTSNKKSLDNTGLKSELTVGAIVVLFLLVGVLLYFKQRKVFIILLMAGLGTQLTPRYSLASEKIRQTENFKDNVSLLEKNISVSLDISYLIEVNQNNESNKKIDSDSNINKNDSKENSNDGDKNNNNNNENKSDNGITNNDNVPKEVVVAGYAYSGKTNNILEEKELKVFDGDKELTTVKTDAEGYFFTHLIQEKTYTIKGEDFEVTVNAKNNGDYEHNDIIGKITLGRELKDEHTYIKIKPSVMYINEDIEYKVEGNNIIIKGNYNLKSGDKLILAPNHSYLTGFAFIVTSVSNSNGETILTGTPITTLDSIVDDFKYNEEVDINSMKFTPAEGVVVEKADTSKMRAINITDRETYKYKDITFYIEGSLNVDIDKNENKYLVTPKVKTGIIADKNAIDVKKEKRFLEQDDPDHTAIKLLEGTVQGYFGTDIYSEVYLSIDGKGNYGLRIEADLSAEAKLGYDGKKYVFEPKADFNMALNLNLTGELYVGPSYKSKIRFLRTIDLMTFNLDRMGPLFRGIAKGGINFKNGNFTPDLTGEIIGYASFKGNVDTPIKALGENEKRIELFRYKKGYGLKDNNKLDLNEIDKNFKFYPVIEKYKQAIKDRGTDDSRINMSAIDLSYTPVLYKLGEKRMTYGYYDINGDGQDELIIFGSQGIADIYAKNSNGDVVKLLPENGAYGVSLSPQITNDNKIIITGTKGGNDSGFDKHVYEVYDFEKDSKSLKLLTSIEGIGKTFNMVHPNKEQMSLQDFINNYEKKYKQNIVDLSNINKTTLIDKDTDSSENIDHVGGYSNAQLALIGRVLVKAVTPSEGVALRGLTMRKNGNSYITGLGNAASDVMVERTVNGISVLTPKYSAVGEEKKFEERGRYSYDELSNIIGENTLDEINDLIKSLKEIGTYKVEEFEG